MNADSTCRIHSLIYLLYSLCIQTPLSLATLANKPHLVRLLVERGVTVNAQVYETGCQGSGPFCAAPVHIASSHGLPYFDTLAELLKSPGIDLTVVDSQGSVQIFRFSCRERLSLSFLSFVTYCVHDSILMNK